MKKKMEEMSKGEMLGVRERKKEVLGGWKGCMCVIVRMDVKKTTKKVHPCNFSEFVVVGNGSGRIEFILEV